MAAVVEPARVRESLPGRAPSPRRRWPRRGRRPGSGGSLPLTGLVRPLGAGLRAVPPRTRISAAAASRGAPEAPEDGEVEAARQRLLGSLRPSAITGAELRRLVVDKYGRSYDVRLCKFNQRVYLQEKQYQEQLDAVAEIVSEWGVADMVRACVKSTKQRPGFTGGGGAKAVSIPLNISRGEGRGEEWTDCF
eukprot:SM000070S21331  [mRNA]  locus=s70:381383:382894:- [translate_table: standard]